MNEQQFVAELGRQDPVEAAKEVLNKFDGILDPDEGLWYKNDLVHGTGNDGQVPWARGAWFHLNPVAAGTYAKGYIRVPSHFHNFVLNRTTVIAKRNDSEAILPYYTMKSYDPKKIERVVIVLAGMWRDPWIYINLMGNAYKIAQKYDELNVNDDSVLIMAPMLFNQLDRDRGAVKDKELSFHDSGWSAGGTAREPRAFKNITSFDVLDFMIDMVMDKSRFPNLKKVVLAGHSMGAQLALHYAIAKKPGPHEDKISYWVGDPGSYVYMSSSRPFSTEDCDSYNDWPYSITNVSTLPKYARHHAGPNGTDLEKNFRSRKIHFAVAENDNGAGVTSCAAKTQGPNRIARASEWIVAQGNSSEGWSSQHTLDYMPGISHQDYPAMAYYFSLKHIFSDV
ncbi:hypothetical protein MCAP1_002394 [Malassezia caprae]|uniref:Uncharacterized protein n=1 Tax=Malassezia caprae TaxID=1381934 RepID=A0AAF0E996_9BASI|nr:hypothetical protein MCAP1_002394 [Malassezia caprae]